MDKDIGAELLAHRKALYGYGKPFGTHAERIAISANVPINEILNDRLIECPRAIAIYMLVCPELFTASSDPRDLFITEATRVDGAGDDAGDVVRLSTKLCKE
jgi:hypothetical protein